MSTTTNTGRAPVESGLQGIRLEWVAESTPGTFPDDPSWNKFTASDHVIDFTVSPAANNEARQAVGFLDAVAHDNATESASMSLSYLQSRFPIDTNGNVQDPVAYPITAQEDSDYPSHTVVARREVSGGGNDSAGFREYAVLKGGRPVSSTFDGAADTPTPLPQELTYEGERARTHIIHQPSSAENIAVKSSSTNDTMDVIIESEDANTTETVTLPGGATNSVATTATFSDIDAIEVQAEHEGDITVGISDGASPPAITTDLLDRPLIGTNTDGVDSIIGIPALGSGSHASSISATGPQFIGTTLDADGSTAAVDDYANRLNTLSATVEREVSREPRQGTRREAIDVGARSVTIDADIAGPYASVDKILDDFAGFNPSSFHWEFDNSDQYFEFANPVVVDSPDYTRNAGDTNYVPSVSLEPNVSGSQTEAVTLNHS